MKNIVMRNLYAVKMHHWGGNQLEIGPVYYCHPEPNNIHDVNAVAIFQEKQLSQKAAYFRREDAKLVKLLFYQNFISSHCYLIVCSNFFKKNLTEISSECQTVWIQISNGVRTQTHSLG